MYPGELRYLSTQSLAHKYPKYCTCTFHITYSIELSRLFRSELLSALSLSLSLPLHPASGRVERIPNSNLHTYIPTCLPTYYHSITLQVIFLHCLPGLTLLAIYHICLTSNYTSAASVTVATNQPDPFQSPHHRLHPDHHPSTQQGLAVTYPVPHPYQPRTQNPEPIIHNHIHNRRRRRRRRSPASVVVKAPQGGSAIVD